MAYGFGSPHVPYDVLLVFDLGGGTLDLTIVEAFEGIMEVISTSGDNYLGGDDFTAAVADWLVQQQQQLVQPHHPQPHCSTTSLAATSSPLTSTSTSHMPSLAGPTHIAPGLSSGPSFGSSASPSTPTPGPASTSSHSFALLRVAEAAKLALSEAVAAARDVTTAGSSSCSSSSSSGSSYKNCSGVSVRVRLPIPEGGGYGGGCGGGADTTPEATMGTVAEDVGGRPGHSGSGHTQDAEAELTLESFEEVVRPLLRRIWWPLEELALATRTQLGGHLPPHLDPRGSSDGSGSGSGSGSSWDMEGPGRREGAAAWDFSIFPSSVSGSGKAAKYVAPPRRLSGLVLVGAATRLPVVRDYITEVTGLPVRPGVDPEVRTFKLVICTASGVTQPHGQTAMGQSP
ncbi:hypothetical protein Vretimale_18408 [Volvox reticuliferus]|uniref:Uncharacterized protein n=2 Tax=Volvox reticuliferus TaxID=1737510 RepID=A0A8J4GX37_9CHLO|nr:hypothetical protein Vretimale_18408 [Volvox reticuliferus]